LITSSLLANFTYLALHFAVLFRALKRFFFALLGFFLMPFYPREVKEPKRAEKGKKGRKRTLKGSKRTFLVP